MEDISTTDLSGSEVKFFPHETLKKKSKRRQTAPKIRIIFDSDKSPEGSSSPARKKFDLDLVSNIKLLQKR